MKGIWTFVVGAVLALLVLAHSESSISAEAVPRSWSDEWTSTDFSKTKIKFNEIMSGGPSKDGIPSIDAPKFVPIGRVSDLGENEPVIAFAVNDDHRVYPLRVLMWHEIVNDVVGGVPVTVTYCPLCNAAIVFDRRLEKGAGNAEDLVLEFGTTGKLRNSDLVMYDRQTQSWWQQFSGEAIVGQLTGRLLTMLPSRLEGFAKVKARWPQAQVLVPNQPNMRAYGSNPYTYYDRSAVPFLFTGEMPKGIAPMARVIVVDGQAWAMTLLRQKGRVEANDVVITWVAGQNSALDERDITKGRDVGNIVVQRRVGGALTDVVHHVTFAFVFNAFTPDGVIHTN